MSEVNEAESRRMHAARQRKMAIQMSRAGESLDSIAGRLGVTRSQARKMVSREARDGASTLAADRRMVHVEALMELWRTLYTPATNGDLPSVDRFLKVEERLSRLLALDLADQVGGGMEDEEIDEENAPARRFVRS
ncbi:helix-turn-helix domain-containing protein [Miltoncostaea oceani]|uniref:helix-turn-helix domain-containing protein n=1 Tax=Miltoncostaea oceani TaxID=2843216 RepID=UPI001C3C5838|nr:hypothetical protein [Miltoncostaea oceani]